jgi:hypothetical protein
MQYSMWSSHTASASSRPIILPHQEQTQSSVPSRGDRSDQRSSRIAHASRVNSNGKRILKRISDKSGGTVLVTVARGAVRKATVRGPENYRVRSASPGRTCSSSFLAELPRFGNSRNIEMTAPSATLPGFRNSEKLKTNALSYSVPRCSFRTCCRRGGHIYSLTALMARL